MISLPGGFVQVFFSDRELTYAEIERSLLDQGLEGISINKPSGSPGETDFTVSVNIPVGKITGGHVPKMEAVATLRAVADALEKIDRG